MRRVAIVVAPALFVEGMLYAVLAPLLPHYVDELGLSTTAAGVLTASFAIGNLAMGLPGGALAARLGGRRTLLIGLVGLVVASCGFAFSRHVALLDAARFVQGGAGSVLWAGGLTWASEAAAADRRGTLIGGLLGVGISGAPFGPLVGGLAIALSPTVVFLAIAVLLVPLAALVLGSPEAPRSAIASESIGRALRGPHLRRTARAVLVALIPSVGFGLIFVLAPLRLSAAGATAAAIAATFVVAGVTEAGANPISGWIIDRTGPRRVLLPALAAAAAMLFVFSLPLGAPALAAVTVLTLSSLGFVWVPVTLGLRRAMQLAGTGDGHGFALFNMSWAGGQAIGAAGGAALAQGVGYGAPSLVSGVLLAAGAAAAARDPRGEGINATGGEAGHEAHLDANEEVAG